MVQYNVKRFADETCTYERNCQDMVELHDEIMKAHTDYELHSDFDALMITVYIMENNNERLVEQTSILF